MLSKEEKLRYGEILRQQMKEKEEKKRQEDMTKRGQPPPQNPQRVQSDRIVLADPSLVYAPPDPKAVLQKKLETQDYNPFGRGGGGAPNPRQEQSVTVNAEGNYSGLVMSNNQQYQRQVQPIYKPHQHPQQYQNAPTNFPMNSVGSYELPKNAGYHQQEQQQLYQKSLNDYPPRQYQEYQPPQQETIRMDHQYPPQTRTQLAYPEQKRQFQPPHQTHEINYSPVEPKTVGNQGDRVRTIQNEQMQEMYRRGGRNLLKLQNETANQHLVKQKQKLEMQAFLKQQMEQTEMRKQMEKEKLRREEMEEERRNREYIEMQNQKLRDEERKKVEEKQRIADENLRNLAKRKELEQEAKDKLERERLIQIENERRREQQGRQQQRQRVQLVSRQKVDPQREGGRSKLSRGEPTQSLGSTSSEHTHGRGFNTDISREFFRKQRQREPQKFRNDKKLQLFTNQIQKMRDQINNQGEMFQKEIERIKRDAENTQIEKRRAQFEIQKLKLQLQKKNKEAELKLLEALKRNDPYPHPDYLQPHKQYHNQKQTYDALSQFEQPRPPAKKYVPPTPPKMPKTNKVQQYESVSYHEQQSHKLPAKFSKKNLLEGEYQPRKFDESQVMTLDADSKKIPLSLQTNNKLTMSKLQNYGKQTLLYGQESRAAKPYRSQQPIMEQMEQSRAKPRKQLLPVDELDRLVGSREQKRWQMSTVKDDITKQIEDLLKKKDRQGSRLGEAGRQAVSRGGLPYDGNINTMNSNRISAVSNGTLDIDKVHDRNEERLRKLKAMGVETINTNTDEDMNRLNELLKHYQ